jgi:Uma2 family endonuclease
VVEIVSDSSVAKDRERLPRLYALAGVPELWLADARGGLPRFEIWTLGPGGYTRVAPDSPGPDAWTTSPLLAHRFRLRGHQAQKSRLTYYDLESEPSR